MSRPSMWYPRLDTGQYRDKNKQKMAKMKNREFDSQSLKSSKRVVASPVSATKSTVTN